jgi:hypothetical protein
VIPGDATLLGRYDQCSHAKLALRPLRACQAALYRIRWAPATHWPDYPWAIVAFPFWRRWEADAVDAQGELVQPELARHLWRCCRCDATWQAGLVCPNCATAVARDALPPLPPPAPEDSWLTLNCD